MRNPFDRVGVVAAICFDRQRSVAECEHTAFQSLHVPLALLHRPEAQAQAQVQVRKQPSSLAATIRIAGHALDLIEQPHRRGDLQLRITARVFLHLSVERHRAGTDRRQIRLHDLVVGPHLRGQGVVRLAHDPTARDAQIAFLFRDFRFQVGDQLVRRARVHTASRSGMLPQQSFEFFPLLELLDALTQGTQHKSKRGFRIDLVMVTSLAAEFQVTTAGQHPPLATAARVHGRAAAIRHIDRTTGQRVGGQVAQPRDSLLASAALVLDH